MKKFRIEWRNAEGKISHGSFPGWTATEAMTIAMEEVELLKQYPHLITRVTDEAKL